jgi:hypothetical protein
LQPLKKIAAILLIGILFFNWYGYRLLSAYWQQRADRLLEQRLDNEDYDESQLIWLKIPVRTLSYSNPSTEFERIDGEIILDDIAYKYVKRRLCNDSVELLCIRNTTVMQMGQAQNEFFRLVNNLTHFPNSKTHGANEIQKVFSPATLSFPVQAPGRIGLFLLPLLTPLVQSGYAFSDERPPEAWPVLT